MIPAASFNQERLAHLRRVIADDVAAGRYFGAVIAVARAGHLGLHDAIGHADSQRSRPLRRDSVFSIFSVTKAITNVLVLRSIELGRFALTTRISDLVPEFSGGLRHEITVHHLLTHTSGLPSVLAAKPDMYIDRLDEVVAAVCANIHPTEPPGERVAYSPMANHALLGEALRRTDPNRRSYRAIVQEDLLAPLKMSDTSVGLRADLRARHVVPDFRGNFPITHPGHSNLGPNGAFQEEDAEMPWVGVASTVPDMFRFAEMLRSRGELDGAQILSPATLDLATRNWTGEKPNELYKTAFHQRGWQPAPAYLGLGFALRGTAMCHHLYGTLTSPGTFGNYGAGSALYWVDPAREITFVCLTAGVMDSLDNIERFQRLSDVAVSAAL
ncbi:MAG: serine hydrolase domain-containing protein [Steroidobacteraceae bacterium]